MKNDIFGSLERAEFGSNVHEIAADGECRVLRLDGESGEGFMTMYRVFDGIYLMYNDFHLKQCVSEFIRLAFKSVGRAKGKIYA